MNEEINWDDAPEGFDLHIGLRKGAYINSFAKSIGKGVAELTNGYVISTLICDIVTERPSLMEENSTQGQLCKISDLLHNLSCSMIKEEHKATLGVMVTQLWNMSLLYKQTTEQRLRAKVWDVVAEKYIRESEIDAITTGILEKFNLEEK